MDLIIIDVVLLVILCILTIFMCGYGFYCVYTLIRSMRMQILLRPTRVLFSHRNEGEETEELRAVVAYQNPFTGDYCVHKSRTEPKGYLNSLQVESPDSGLSEEYEPLNLETSVQPPRGLHRLSNGLSAVEKIHSINNTLQPTLDDNSVNRTWNWNYKEYQI